MRTWEDEVKYHLYKLFTLCDIRNSERAHCVTTLLKKIEYILNNKDDN